MFELPGDHFLLALRASWCARVLRFIASSSLIASTRLIAVV